MYHYNGAIIVAATLDYYSFSVEYIYILELRFFIKKILALPSICYKTFSSGTADHCSFDAHAQKTSVRAIFVKFAWMLIFRDKSFLKSCEILW